MEREPGAGRPPWALLALTAAAFWTFIAILYSLQIWWLASSGGETINLRRVLTWQATYYLAWIPFTLLVWLLTWTWMPDRLGWPRFLLSHAGVAVGVVALHTLALTSVALPISGDNMRFWPTLSNQLRGRLHTQLLVYAAIAATGQAILLYRRYRERQVAALRLEGQLTAARLEALQSHVQPHFLFNSLHSIASLARAGDHAGVVKLTADLSDLLRSSLDGNGRRHQTVREEMQLVERYLAIQRVRFQDRLTHSVDIAPEVTGALVPRFIAQPLVENAVRHGVGVRVGPGEVRVRAFRDGARTAIVVEDDGVGLPVDWDVETGNGTGLRNLAARLQAEFGAAHSLDISNRPGGGVVVTVRIPAIAS